MKAHLKKDMLRLKGRLFSLSDAVRKVLVLAADTIQAGPDPSTDDFAAFQVLIDEAAANLDEECLKIIALHQPDEKTLRHVTGVIKLGNDLRIIGETAENLVRRIPVSEIPGEERQSTAFTDEDAALSENVLHLFDEALKAFIRLDARQAQKVRGLSTLARESVQRAVSESTKNSNPGSCACTPFILRLYVLGQLEIIAEHLGRICLETVRLFEKGVLAAMVSDEP